MPWDENIPNSLYYGFLFKISINFLIYDDGR